VSAAQLAAVKGPTFLERRAAGTRTPIRLLVVPADEPGQRLYVVAGSSLESRQEVLSRFLFVLTIGGTAALALASAAGWALAGAALRPVERMRREAAAISVSDQRRLPVPETGDEIERLGATLNSMLDRLQQAFNRERRFVDDASHELRSPLTILKAELDLALARPRTPPELEGRAPQRVGGGGPAGGAGRGPAALLPVRRWAGPGAPRGGPAGRGPP